MYIVIIFNFRAYVFIYIAGTDVCEIYLECIMKKTFKHILFKGYTRSFINAIKYWFTEDF